MTDDKAAWAEVGDRLEALALKLKLHAKEELSDDGKNVKSALDRLCGVINETAEAVDDAVNDPAVRADAKEAVNALARAITKTLERVPTPK